MKRTRLIVWTFGVLMALNAIAAYAEPKVFYLNEDSKDVVQFTSKAQLEKIVGLTNKVRAAISVEDIADLTKGKTTAIFEVDLASLNTNNQLRDQHLRDQYLETSKYPKAIFTLDKIESVQVIEKDAQGNNRSRPVKGLQPNIPTRLFATGTFEMHGKKNPARFNDIVVTYVPASQQTARVRKGDLLMVESNFRVKLTDYDIKKPQFLVLRIADEIEVSVDVIGGTEEKKPELVSDKDDAKSAEKK